MPRICQNDNCKSKPAGPRSKYCGPCRRRKEVERVTAYYADPINIEKRRAAQRRYNVSQKRRSYMAEYNKRPDVIERRKKRYHENKTNPEYIRKKKKAAKKAYKLRRGE